MLKDHDWTNTRAGREQSALFERVECIWELAGQCWRFLLPSHLGLLSEEQLWSTGHRQMICQTGGGSGKRQGEERVKRPLNRDLRRAI